MQITEVKIYPAPNSNERLVAFASITIDDCFVCHEMKIVNGDKGPFVAMPSRKLTDHCPTCNTRNHLTAAYCNRCGEALPENRVVRDPVTNKAKLFADIAHPINPAAREQIQKAVLNAYVDFMAAEEEMHAGSEVA